MLNKTISKHALGLSLIAGAIAGAFTLPAQASSHREAPYVTRQPKTDATDFYMFRSYESGRSGYVTLIANYIPLQEPGGGPNYYAMDPDALYEIHIDNNGDAKEDLTFQFRFNYQNKDTKLNVNGKQVSIPLIINGASDINSVNSAAANVRETYSINVVRGDRRAGSRQPVTNASGGGTSFDKPLDNIGNKSISDYASYANKHIYEVNIPGCQGTGRVFVGQRKDPFVVNLGETFDLINIKAPATAFDPNAERAATDSLAKYNVTSIAMEVPVSCLATSTEPVIGGWTTASLRQGRLLNPSPSNGGASKEGGAWTQVSRLGMPLVNEVVIGLKDKDQFNASKPSGDGQFADYVTNPTLPLLVQTLFSSAGVKAPTNYPRNDLVAAFLTGVKGVNQPANVVASEMLRLNTSTPVAATQNRLGVIGGDAAGFPNGRRPGDDVVDIALRVVMGRLCKLNIGCAPADAPAGDIDFTDGAYVDSSMFDNAFPYVKAPLAGSVKH
ncbi:DUF4331 domain-containing protein [Noviherbaspirillum galbum]|uniref:DUF4331 domain-containing protein n=1 Tax=Noviherbaspirillum galbum TaxID=2709383 RepID=A0A6B3SLC7_9BURK|nr:DUF4331 domain-containing protein [Noviherbaspirillum galbum]NEX61537.1 DUF4331 domain-containing protein [Noviherbaspirillum galbum]